jgi:spore coat protein U domain-containing protein, fimbrial subunit CupE1/2/3/6
MKPGRRTRLYRAGIRAAATLLGALAATPARADSGITCSVSATSLSFGNYVPFAAVATDVNATITVNCSATGSSTVPLSGTISLTSTRTSYARQLTSGTNTVRYHTYLNSAMTVFWGDGTGLGATQSVSGSVGPASPFQQSFTVYGSIPAGQTSTYVGSYTDQVTVTLNY